MDLPNRRLPRLTGYDYATPNYYFVTICTHGMATLFGAPHALNAFGKIAEASLLEIAEHFNGVKVDQYAVMPNHIHAIVVLGCDGGAERSRPLPTLSTVVGAYKSGVSRLIHRIQPELKVWQSSFHDHVIRNETEYREIARYIEENPLKWEEDCFYPCTAL